MLRMRDGLDLATASTRINELGNSPGSDVCYQKIAVF
jgi:hypothetical protein